MGVNKGGWEDIGEDGKVQGRVVGYGGGWEEGKSRGAYVRVAEWEGSLRGEEV